MKVAVTGASGFIGRSLCPVLAGAGHEVTALVRQPGDGPIAGAARVQIVGDLAQASDLAGSLAGSDAVVHLAGRAHRLRESGPEALTAFREVNVRGTERLLAAAAAAGISRFLLASSVKAVGESSREPWTERTEPAPGDPYGVSKREAELAVARWDTVEGMRTAVVRLPLVYGPGAGANVRRLVSLVRSGVPLPLGSIRNARSMLFVGNAAEAFLAVLESPGAAGETFFAADEEAPSTPDLIRMIASALGVPARLVPCPVGILRAMGHLADVVRRAVPLPVGSEDIERLTGSLVVDTAHLRQVTGFRPPVRAAEGWRVTALALARIQP